MARWATQGSYRLPKHVALYNRIALEVAAGTVDRVAILTPPQHGKSEFWSRWFPAWYRCAFPDRKVLLASYAFEWAQKWGRDARDAAAEVGPELFGVGLAKDPARADFWSLDVGAGYMAAAGVGGPTTGKGAHVFVVDDPHKNWQDASSLVHREAAWDWFRSVARTRFQPGAAAVLVMTRWHEDDLGGRILRHGDETGKPWLVVSLPAIAEEDERGPFGWQRDAGEALWPDRYSVADLEATKLDVGSYFWSALYQQRPAPASGFIFHREMLRRYERTGDAFVLYDEGGPRTVLAANCRRAFCVDLAASTKTQADYTVVLVYAVTPERKILVLDVQKARLEGPDQAPLIQRLAAEYRPSKIGVEATAYQLSLVQQLRRLGLPVAPIRADRDKVARAIPAAARVETGDVYLPRAGAWVGDFEEELALFPKGAHDDQVDALAYAVAEVAAVDRSKLVTW